MARQSKKVLRQPAVHTDLRQLRVYKTALYARLSTEDPEDQTIENQLELLRQYITGKPQFMLAGEYQDNGYTGTNFDRPDFQRLLTQIQGGNVDCVIVKDLSRLGRNYIETGTFLEKLCPMLGLRVIAINDNFDNLEVSSSSQLTVSLANVMNDLYAKDISRKASSALQGKMERGEYVGNYAPYGYLKDPENKNHLIPNPELVPVVQRIFRMRADGVGIGTIAATLNRESIPSPGRYRYEHGIVTNNNKKGANLLWGRHVLNDLLRNVAYIGNLAQARCRQALYKGQSFHRTNSEDWITVENTHEAIVSAELFAQVQAVNDAAARTYHQNCGKYKSTLPEIDNPFGKRLICANCGAVIKLVRSISTKKDKAYFNYKCPAYIDSQGQVCTAKSIKKVDLEAAVLTTIQLHIQLFLQHKKVIEKLSAVEQQNTSGKQFADEIKKTEKKLRQRERLRADLYMDLRQGLLSESEYQSYRTAYAQEIESLQQKLAELQACQQANNVSLSRYPNWLQLTERFQNISELTKEVVEAFIKTVRLFDNGEIEVTLNYMDEYNAAKALSEKRGEEVA